VMCEMRYLARQNDFGLNVEGVCDVKA
jgi:hypothetical protein